MAILSLPVKGGVHGTLSGTTADTVNVSGFRSQVLKVIVLASRNNAGAIYARGDKSTAVAEASGTHVIDPGGYVVIDVEQTAEGGELISVVGQNGYKYSCERA